MVVRMRTSRGKRNQRRSHHAIAVSSVTGDGVPRHHASRTTGTYRNRKVEGIQRREIVPKREKNGDTGEKRTVEQASIPTN